MHARRRTILIGIAYFLAATVALGGNNRWTFQGPFGGTITGFTFHPKLKKIVFATGISGLYRSVDAGKSWKRLLFTEEAFPRAVRIHPKEPDRILYAKGDFLFSSTDLGETWSLLADFNVRSPLFAPDPILELRFHPEDPRILYAALCCGLGIYKSTDGGNTWTKKRNGLNLFFLESPLLEVNPHNGNEVYVVGGRAYKSTDGAESWQLTSNGLDFSENEAGNASLVINPKNSQELYVAGSAGVFKTTNGGRQWNLTNCNCIPGSLAIDPNSPRTVYVFGNRLLKSTDGAATWKESFAPPETFFIAAAVDPQSGNILAGGLNHGVFRSINRARTWRNTSAGIDDLDVLRLEANPQRPGHVLAVDQSGTVYESIDGGKTWDLLDTLGSFKASDVLIHQRNPEIVAAAGQAADVAVSADGGKSWEIFQPYGSAQPDCQFSFCESIRFIPDLQNQSTFYVLPLQLAGKEILRSRDFGRTWEPISRTLKANQFFGIAVDPANSNILYVIAGSRKFLFKTTDGGKNWSNLRISLDNILIDRSDPNILYGAHSSFGLMKSTNAGQNWVPKDFDTHGRTYLFSSSSDSKTIFADGEFEKAFFTSLTLPRISLNQGEAWRNFDTKGMPQKGDLLLDQYDLIETPWPPFSLLLATERGIFSYTPAGPAPLSPMKP